MNFIFSVTGGSGSTFLVQSLSNHYDVGNKPDTVFRNLFPLLRIDNDGIDQGTFYERSNGCHIDLSLGPGIAWKRYVEYLNKKPDRVAVLNTFPELGILSNNFVSNVVFLVRHPMHAYVSWAKPERHGDVVNRLGGIEADENINYHISRWNRVTNEYLKLKELDLNPVLLRYEFLKEDLPECSRLHQVFSNFDSSKRNHGLLTKESENKIRIMSEGNYFKIYQQWDV